MLPSVWVHGFPGAIPHGFETDVGIQGSSWKLTTVGSLQGSGSEIQELFMDVANLPLFYFNFKDYT